MTEKKKNPQAPHLGTKNLIPLNQRTKEDAARIQSMGGIAGAKSRAISMKLNALARKGLTDESAREIYEIMTDSDLSSLDILMHIQKIKDKTTDSKEKMMVSKLMLDWHKSHHGEKHKQEVQVFGSSSIHIKFDDPGKREEKVE